MAAKNYHGSCQCGAVAYDVEADLDTMVACNCSMCGRSGAVWTFTPAAKFQLRSGEAKLTDYQFHKHIVHNLFCSVCGIKSFSRGVDKDESEIVAINVRCLDGVDVHALQPVQMDNR